MKDTILTKTGKLHERFLPAIYFDTSVLIDYWMTEGMEMPESEIEMLMSETWLNPSFAIAHGLQGLLQVDIVNFHLSVSKAWEEPSDYAYLQLGIADIMHILLAQHLGCQYIASFDSDFARVKDIITEKTGMTTLTKPEEILDIF